jgi:hydrogenase maturation protease
MYLLLGTYPRSRIYKIGKMMTLVIGVGNPLRGDDGVGPEMIKRLQALSLPADVTIIDGGTDSMMILEMVRTHTGRTIIIDAVDMRCYPGDIKIFKTEDVHTIVNGDSLSTHGFGLAETIHLMEALEIDFDITIIGMQPRDISFHEGFTPEIETQLDTLQQTLEKEILCSPSPTKR